MNMYQVSSVPKKKKKIKTFAIGTIVLHFCDQIGKYFKVFKLNSE